MTVDRIIMKEERHGKSMKKNTIHLKAPGNWINDPNGFIYYKGMYHLFYQHFPYLPRWGTMHWGHAVSPDLVHWEHLGIALFPTRFEDQNGCFSGSAVESDGRMYLYYTGVRYTKQNPLNIHKCLGDNFESSQLMLVSEDGFHFDNFRKEMIIPPIEDAALGDRTHTRDPKVWRGKDAWYMVLGTKWEDGYGKLLFYRSENLHDWTYVNSTEKTERLGGMWECPDYFTVDGSGVLIFSPMGILTHKGRAENHAVCTLAEFQEESCAMKLSEQYQLLDYGLDLYAPQSTQDAEGRRVVVAWMRMPVPVDGIWSGMFCIPRVVEAKDGHIYFRPHPNVKSLYTRRIKSPAEADAAGYRVSVDLEDGDRLNIGGYEIYREGKRICTDRTAVFEAQEDSHLTFSTPEVREGFHLDIYVDTNLIEVYVNDGEYVVSNVVYGLGDEISADGGKGLLIETLE